MSKDVAENFDLQAKSPFRWTTISRVAPTQLIQLRISHLAFVALVVSLWDGHEVQPKWNQTAMSNCHCLDAALVGVVSYCIYHNSLTLHILPEDNI